MMNRNELIELNMKHVWSIAHTYSHKRDVVEELAQEGMLGLIEAASRYEETRNVKFITYAYTLIHGRIRDRLRRERRSRRIDRTILETLYKDKAEKTDETKQYSLMYDLLTDVESVLTCLPNKHARLFRVRFGLNETPAESWGDAAQRVGWSRAYGFQVGRSVLEKIKVYLLQK